MNLAKVLLIGLGFGVLVLALSSFTSRPAAAVGGAPVTVLNTPLPVQGTVNATQAGSWNVGITGTPSVTVANTPTVNIANTTPLLTQVIESPAAQYASEQLQETCVPGSLSNLAFCNFDSIPAGKGLVIETVSCVVEVPEGHPPAQLTLTTFDSNVPYIVRGAGMFLPIIHTGQRVTGYDRYVANVPLTRIFATQTPQIIYIRGDGDTSGNMPGCFLTGHLVNLS